MEKYRWLRGDTEEEKNGNRLAGSRHKGRTVGCYYGSPGRDVLYGKGPAFYLYGKRRRVFFGQEEEVDYPGCF